VSAIYLGYRPWSGLNILYDYFEKDTIVADTPCKCWRQKYHNPKKGTTNIFTVAAYEDDGKVWFFHEGETTRRLAYDFKAEIGDTVVISSADAQIYNYYKNNPYYGVDHFNRYYQDTILIVDKSSMILDGWELEYIQFSSGYFDLKGPSEYHFYRLGSLIRPNYNHSARATSQTKGLLYCTVGDEVIYYNQSTIDFWQEAANYYDITLPIPTSISSTTLVSGERSNGNASTSLVAASRHHQPRECILRTGRRLHDNTLPALLKNTSPLAPQLLRPIPSNLYSIERRVIKSKEPRS
jgi:hypothetical protein